MYERLVVGTDGSETADRAVREAAKLARAFGSDFHVVVAYRASGPGMGHLAGAPIVESGSERILLEAGARQVGEKAVDAWGGGLSCHVHAVAGDPADVILQIATAVNADLVIVGNKGMQGARRVLGSVPNSVTHNAGCSVLIVQTDS